MDPKERESRRQRMKARRELDDLLQASSLGTAVTRQVIEEGNRRSQGSPTMTDTEYLNLIEKSLKE